MMRQMRDNMKWIMGLTAITFVGLMVFGWGMDITGRSSTEMTGGELGRVNGEPITFNEWQALKSSLYEARARQPNAPVGAALDKQLGEEAWNQLVMQKLIGQELRRLGINVTDAEVRQAARFVPPQEFMSNPFFQTNGQFDLNKYHQFLATPQADDQMLLQLEAYYRELIPRSKLFYQATTGSYLPEGELWRMWRDTHETVKVNYIFFDPNVLVADNRVSVTPREIERYYDDHKDEFERPARAQVRYAFIDRTPNAADTAAARARVQRVRQEIQGGAKFEDVAKRESADSVSGAQGGSLGKVQRGQTVPAFEQALFSLPIGQLSEPVETPYGYHLIQVQSRTGDEAEARHILIPIRPTPEREEQLLTLADSLDVLSGDGPLETAARALGLTVRTAEIVPGLAFLPGVGQAEEGAIWVFDEAEVGELSEVFDAPTSFYSIELVERTEKGTLTLQEATPTIRSRLMQEKKLEEAKQIARRAVDRVRSGGTLEQAAQSVGLKVQEAGPFTRLDYVPGLGRANAAIGTAFGLKPGAISDVVEAEGALFILQTTQRVEANRAEWEKQKAEQSQRVADALAQQRWSQYLQSVRQEAKIVDNREVMLRRADDPAATTN